MEYNQSNVNKLGATNINEEYSHYKLAINEHPFMGENEYLIFNDRGKISLQLQIRDKVFMKFIFLGFIMFPLQINNFDFSNIWVKSYIIVYSISNSLTLLNQYKNEQIVKIVVAFKRKMTMN